MGEVTDDKLKDVTRHFRIHGEPVSVAPVGHGHINDTYVLTVKKMSHSERYILQRINHDVFKDPLSMMANISRITRHISEKMKDIDPVMASRHLSVINTNEGRGFHKDSYGNFWRVYNYIEDAVTHDILESTDLAFESARMFGLFQRILIDLPEPALNDTIVDFHNTLRRLEVFQHVLEKDTHNRAVESKPEIDFLLRNSEICNVLQNLVDKGEIPVRIAHNDAKINNVMLDEKTNKGVCVIDLDTVMPGLSLYDFGDMVRTATCSAAEDERDLSKVDVDISMFEALVRGYAIEAEQFLTPAERKNLVSAGKLITFEQFMRFLTDYLVGDTYYKISREKHNLDRSRTQMKLLRSIIEKEEMMTGLVRRVFEEKTV